MIRLKNILLEGMTVGEANRIFSKYGIPDASKLDKENLKKAWRALSAKYHPDAGGNNNAMQYINTAYDVLKLKSPFDRTSSSYTSSPTRPTTPSSPPPGRTYPKGTNKAKLQKEPIHFYLYGGEDDCKTEVGSGSCDYFDLAEINLYLKKQRLDFWSDPRNPYNETYEKWEDSVISQGIKIFIKIDDSGKSTAKLYKIIEILKQMKDRYF